MAKNETKTTVQPQVVESVSVAKIDGSLEVHSEAPLLLRDKAFTIAKNKKTGKWHLVTVEFDFEEKNHGEIKQIEPGNDEMIIMFDELKKAIGNYVWG